MRRAFTLIELVVSLGILAVILSFAGVIFRVSIDSQRMAMANAEIMQKLRVITEQLDADFKGGAFQYPYIYGGYLSASSDVSIVGGKPVPVNSDALVFFTCGDFRSTGQYHEKTTDPNKTIAGNVASVLYSQADPNSYSRSLQPHEKILLRRQTILAISAPGPGSNALGEYCRISPQQWLVNPPVDSNDWVRRPVIEPNNIKTSLPMYVAQGVDNLTIHYLNVGTQLQAGAIPWERYTGRSRSSTINPKAFRFTFTLYDSKGIIKKGRTFTHIVLLES